MEERSLGFEIKLLNNLITRRIIKDSKEYNGFSVSQVQMKIIHYLIDHIDKPIYQRDIEKKLMVRRSTASGILNTMEKNGFIKRVSSKEDARLKQIIICDKTLDLAKHFKNKALYFDNLLGTSIDECDKKIFYKVIDQMKKNISD